MRLIARGSGYIGNTHLNSTIDSFYGERKWPANATWPLVSLTVHDTSVEISVVGNKEKIAYEDISTVYMNKSGQLLFRDMNSHVRFAFAGLKVKSIVQALQTKGVHVDNASLQHINRVLVLSWLTLLVLCSFGAFVLYRLIVGLL